MKAPHFCEFCTKSSDYSPAIYIILQSIFTFRYNTCAKRLNSTNILNSTKQLKQRPPLIHLKLKKRNVRFEHSSLLCTNFYIIFSCFTQKTSCSAL